MGNTRNTGYLQNAIKVSDAGAISFMSGSTMLATINTTGQMSGSSPVLFASTASFVANAQTASFVALAQSASNAVSAQTASFANAFTVASTLTAQTLVVQTITSSVDFVTGSTRFGSILGNTHVFSGSVTMNPGGLFVSSSGNVGIGNTNPTVKLQVTMNVGSGYPTLGVGNSGSLFIAGDTNQYGLYIGNDGVSGNAWLQSMRNNTATAYNIILNPVGGNVGIGTTNPLSRLNVSADNNDANSGQLILNGSTDGTRRLSIGYNTTSNFGFISVYTALVGYNALALQPFGGNVGIGTSSPIDKLTVSGRINILGTNQNSLWFNQNGGGTSTGFLIGRSYTSADTQDFFIYDVAAASRRLEINSSGVAIFSNNVTATSFGGNAYPFNSILGNGTDASTSSIYAGSTSAYVSSIDVAGGGATNPNTIIFKTASAERMRITSGGRVLVGTTTDNGRGNIQTNDNISANNITTFSLTLQGLSTPVSTGLGINAYSGGRTYLLLTSQQWSDGNSTSATITMIRCGYDGNNFSAVVLGSSNATTETWSQSGGILYVTGNTNFQLDITVLSNG